MEERNDREMTLDEWCGKLSKFHLVNSELESLKKAPAQYAELIIKMAEQLKSMRKLHDPNGGCHCHTCLQVVALEYECDNLIKLEGD